AALSRGASRSVRRPDPAAKGKAPEAPRPVRTCKPRVDPYVCGMIGAECDFTASDPGPPVPERPIKCGSGSRLRGIFVVTTRAIRDASATSTEWREPICVTYAGPPHRRIFVHNKSQPAAVPGAMCQNQQATGRTRV